MRLKSELYKKEQEEMCDKIIEILDLPETNTITLYELDNDKEKQKKIIELIPDIRKYFSFIVLRLLEKHIELSVLGCLFLNKLLN